MLWGRGEGPGDTWHVPRSPGYGAGWTARCVGNGTCRRHALTAPMLLRGRGLTWVSPPRYRYPYLPLHSTAFTSTPKSMRSSAVFTFPSSAAQCRGVRASVSRLLMSNSSVRSTIFLMYAA